MPALTMADVMTRQPICATPGMTIRELATIFAEKRISGAPVIGPDGNLVGVVSRTDLFRRITLESKDARPGFLFDLLNHAVPTSHQPIPEALLTIGDFMTEDAVTATADELVGAVARRMSGAGVHRVVVVDNARRPIGIVTSLDLLRVFPA